jgi:hypothetical protein
MLTIRQLFPPFSLEEEDDEDEVAEDGTAEKNGKAEEEDNSEPDIILDEFSDLEQTGRKSVNGLDEDMAAGETDQTDEATAVGETDQSDEATAAGETDQSNEATAAGETVRSDEATAAGEADQTDTTAAGEADQSDEATVAGETDQTDKATASAETDQTDEATAAGKTDNFDRATAAGETDQTDQATAAGETLQSNEASATEREQDSEEKMEAENDPVVEAKPKSEVGQNTEDELELKATPKEDDFKAEAEATKLEAVEQQEQEPEVKNEAVSTQQTLLSPKTETDTAENINEASATNESEVEAMDTDERGLVERKANIPAKETPDVAPSEKVGGVDAINVTDASDGSADVKDQEDDDIGKSSIEGFSKENASGEESKGFTAARVATDLSAEEDTSLTLSKDESSADKVGAVSDRLDYNSESGVGASILTS